MGNHKTKSEKDENDQIHIDGTLGRAYSDVGEKYLVLKKKYLVPGKQIKSGPSHLYEEDEEPPSYKPPPPPEEPTYDVFTSPLPPGAWSLPGTPQIRRDEIHHPSSTPQSHHQSPRRIVSPDVYSLSSTASATPTASLASSVRSISSRDTASTTQPSSLRSSVSRESISTPPSTLRSSASRESITASHRSSASSMSISPKDPAPTPPLSPEPPPPVPPRRKSSDKSNNNFKETNLDPKEAKENKRPKSFAGESDKDCVDESKISVRERLQKFNRLASECQLSDSPMRQKKRIDKVNDKDEEDSASVNSLQLDPKFREWLVKCSQGDYQPVAKMAAENPRLVKMKNTANGYTALHWAAKYGNQDLVKLIAGTYGANVNARTNGGYTALHIAMQYGHEDLYNLLVKVYGADTNIRDWSGKKARQYLTNKDTTVSADTFRKLKARKKQSEHGFLRIGSLNVRVKKTTEAFSNFLGVGHGDKLHKNWGSADDLPQDDDCKKMPPPKQAVVIKKRKSKRGADFGNTGGGTYSRTSEKSADNAQDSDSDTAAGFGSQWQSTV